MLLRTPPLPTEQAAWSTTRRPRKSSCWRSRPANTYPSAIACTRPATHTPCIIRHACTTHARRTCNLLQAADDFRNFRVAGATRQVVSQLPLLGRAAASRAPVAAMAMGGLGQIVSKPKATPEDAEAEGEVGSEAAASAAASPGRGGGDPVMQQSMAVEAEVGLPTGLPWPMPARLFTREEALDTLFDVGSSQPVERGVYLRGGAGPLGGRIGSARLVPESPGRAHSL